MEYDEITRYIYEFIQPNKTGRVLTRALSSISILAVAFSEFTYFLGWYYIYTECRVVSYNQFYKENIVQMNPYLFWLHIYFQSLLFYTA